LTCDDATERIRAGRLVRVIRVRLFAALRELAGASEISDLSGRTVGELADRLEQRYGERFAHVAGVSSFVVNGERASRATVLADGDEMAILPPVSGGC
jgi:MoaD family protein